MPRKKLTDRHDWNTIENYLQIYHDQLDNHPFIDHSQPLPEFDVYEEGDSLIVVLEGDIFCKNNIVLSVTKYFAVKELKDGRFQIRCYSYRYNAGLSGKFNVLRYDNTHAGDGSNYHKHEFDINTGKEIRVIPMTRNQFPLLHEIINELASMFDR